MRALDWVVIASYLIWIVYDGLRRTKAADKIEGYFLANRSLPWWAVGLSIMATQLSAITLVGTTGQAYADGMRFVQFYFGLPIAMVVLSITLVPFFYRSGVYTAYEYLERRFVHLSYRPGGVHERHGQRARIHHCACAIGGGAGRGDRFRELDSAGNVSRDRGYIMKIVEAERRRRSACAGRLKTDQPYGAHGPLRRA